MSLTGKPVVTKMQVGETAYWLSGGEIRSALIERITVEVSNPANDGNGVQTNTYKLSGQADNVPESKIFHSKNALLFSIKGTYLNKWTNTTFTDSEFTVGASNDYSYTDFSGVVLNSGSMDFNEAILDGCRFNSDISQSDLSNCSMKYAVLTGATITGCNFSGANLTGATMPAGITSKATFKAAVGSYTGCKWIDGTVVT